MKKKYVLDTSTLITDPASFKNFPDSDVIIPIAILHELDNLKKQANEAGKNARVCIKLLDDVSAQGNICNGILLENNCTVRVDISYFSNSSFGPIQYGDTQILSCAHEHFTINKDLQNITLVSNDINLRVKAKSFGMQAIPYNGTAFSLSDIYPGFKTIKDEAGIETDYLLKNNIIDDSYDLLPNECIIFTNNDNEVICLGKKCHNGKIKLIRKNYPWGLTPRNKEQALAIDLLLDKNIDLITLIGKAGTGKSLVVLACALELVLNKKEYDKFIIYRPIQPVGNDIGFLPGDMSEKLAPWFQAIMDNLEFLLGSKNPDWKKQLEMYQSKGRIEMEAITYIRGRSLPNSIILVDECFPYNQNIATDKGKIKIGKIYDKFVNNEELPLIKSYNEHNNTFEYKKITNAWNKGKRELLEIKCGNRKIKCTSNHRFLTNNGWIQADKLQIGNLIKTSEPVDHQLLTALNDDQIQIVLGSFLGDGNLDCIGKSRYRLRVIHGMNQYNYCGWKASMFNSDTKIIEKNGYSQKPAIQFQSLSFCLEKELPKTKTYCPQWVLDNLDDRGLAIWFMDDGSIDSSYGARISTCSFDENSQQRMVEKLNSYGIYCKYSKLDGEWYISISSEGCIELFDRISQYMHNDLSYKTNTIIGGYVWNNNFQAYGYTVVDSILDIKEFVDVYDIEVEDNHNFIVCSSSQGKNATNSGLIAHNCQNLSKEEVKTILTRAGENTKIILTGDIEQIDNSALDATSNGLTHVIEKFKESDMTGHITFTQGERSRLASLASEIL